MDVVRGSVDETIARAKKEYNGGNYRGALAFLLPLLRAKDKLSPQQEYEVVSWLGQCYRFLDDHKAALPHAQRVLVLTQEVDGPRSLGHAAALKVLCMVHTGLKAIPAAREAIVEALAIMDELGLQQHEQYGSMLVVLGRLDHEEGWCKEALVIYNKAKAVLVQYKEGDYFVLVNDMAVCHMKLHEWNEAVTCCKEAVEHARNLYGSNHPEYAAALNYLAVLFSNLKQYDEAVPRFEEVLTIRQRVYGDQHQHTVQVAKDLAAVRLLALERNRDVINLGHNYGMCNQCGKVEDQMSKCNGCNRAWYCNEECQLLHWPTHKPQCDVCMECGTVLTKILRCSCCMKAKYCGAACSKAHWSVHKKECRRATNK